MDHNDVKQAIIASGILENPPSNVQLLFNCTASLAGVLVDGFLVLKAKTDRTDDEGNLLYETCQQLIKFGFGGLQSEAFNVAIDLAKEGFPKYPEIAPIEVLGQE